MALSSPLELLPEHPATITRVAQKQMNVDHAVRMDMAKLPEPANGSHILTFVCGCGNP
jgi:hypothetical protein